MQAANETLQAEQALRAERAKVARLKTELAERQRVDPNRDAAQEVFEHWVARCHPTAQSFAGKRLKAVLARLREGLTVGQLKRAIDGCVVSPFVKDGVRYDDLELICRDATKVELFIKRAEAYDERRRLARTHGKTCDHPVARALEKVGMGGWLNREADVWQFPCPCCAHNLGDLGLSDGHERVLRDLLGDELLLVRSLRIPSGGAWVWCEHCGATGSKVAAALAELVAAARPRLELVA